MALTRHFLGWDAPVVHLAIERLLAAALSSPPDLSRFLVVVPTIQSGRRLRYSLARHTSRTGTACIPPLIVTPDYFFQPPEQSAHIAGSMETTAAWVRVLLSFERGLFRSLFPYEPEPRRDIHWAFGIADSLTNLRNLLSDSGLTIRDVADMGLDAVQDIDRWNDLASLEREYQLTLETFNRLDPVTVKIECASNPQIPDSVDSVILCAVPDPAALALTALEHIAEIKDVQAWIHAPPDLEGRFDSWGRPTAGAWEQARLTLPPLPNIRLCADARTQADECTTILGRLPRPLHASHFALCAPSQSIFPYIESSCAAAGLAVYNPAGIPVAHTDLFRVVESLSRCVVRQNYESLASLLRIPAVFRRLERKHNGFDSTGMLGQIDALQNAHMTESLADTGLFLSRDNSRLYPDLRSAFTTIMEIISGFGSSRPGEFVRGFLAFVFDGVEAPQPADVTSIAADSAVVAGRLLDEMDSGMFASPVFTAGMQIELLVEALRRKNVFPQHPPDAVPVQGWLETPWEDAPTLVVAGFNEGSVPESVVGDLFLPDSAREKLSVKNNRTRFVRDLYLFASMLAWRGPGNVHCIVGKTDVQGDPLKPSRLLFTCPDAELAARARHLFGEPFKNQDEIIRPAVQWKLTPPRAVHADHMQVTAFRDYLACPFRYYLGRVVGMEHTDDRCVEADALVFGIACHRPLELLGREASMRTVRDSRLLAEFLQEQARAFIAEKYGNNLSLAVMIQLEALMERLGAAARIEAQQRNEGWETVSVEYRLGSGSGILVNGMPVSGTIDRIDRRGDTVRIIDYKTSDSAEDPAKGHVKNATGSTPAWACFEENGAIKAWHDLQLPLYRHFLSRDPAFEGCAIECGYFALPKATADTGVFVWDTLCEHHIHSAVRCAERIIENIRNAVFWPPSENAAHDPFEELHAGDLRNVIDEEYFTRLLEGMRQ
jgi:ATP-dependent helicase/nuclease subunit B